jgi:hypothetical protein
LAADGSEETFHPRHGSNGLAANFGRDVVCVLVKDTMELLTGRPQSPGVRSKLEGAIEPPVGLPALPQNAVVKRQEFFQFACHGAII